MKKISIFWLFCLAALSAFAQSKEELSNQALAAYNRKEYVSSASLYVQAIRKGALDADNYYNAACCYALSGDKENAFLFLEQSIRGGYHDAEHLQKDTDLDTLHADPRWPGVVASTQVTARRLENFWNGPSLRSSYKPDLTVEEKVAGLSKLWSEVKFNFANFDLVPGLDWDSLYRAYLPKVMESRSTADYYRLLSAVMAQLHDGHSNVYVPDTLANDSYARPAFRTRLIENKVIVATVWEEGLRKQGIREGAELLEIDGQAVKEYAGKFIRPYQSSSTGQDLDVRTYEYALLTGAAGSSVSLLLADEKGKRFTCQVKRVSVEERRKYTGQVPGYQLTWLKDSIALVSLNNFESDKTANDFLNNFPVLSRASAIIFDVRDNGGGSSDVGYKILACLTRKDIAGSAWRTRDYRPALRAWGRSEGWYGYGSNTFQPNGTYCYDKPVYVLIGPKTFSAAEDFAVAFDAMHRGVLVGEPTGGSTGQPLFFYLPGGGSARVCSKRDTYPDGKEFVGVGVQPGIRVTPTVADYRKGRDTVLEAAVAEIGKKR